MAREIAKNLFLEAAGSTLQTGVHHYTDAQIREAEGIIGMLERAGFVVNDPASAPLIAPFAFTWARLPPTPNAGSDETVTREQFANLCKLAEQATAATGEMKQQIAEVSKAVAALAEKPSSAINHEQIAKTAAGQLADSLFTEARERLRGMVLIAIASLLLLAFIFGVLLQPSLSDLHQLIFGSSTPTAAATS